MLYKKTTQETLKQVNEDRHRRHFAMFLTIVNGKAI